MSIFLCALVRGLHTSFAFIIEEVGLEVFLQRLEGATLEL